MQKACTTCGVTKDVIEFNRKGDRWQPSCRECQAAWYAANKDSHIANVKRRMKRVQAETKETVNQIKAERGCTDCGENDPIVLDFDHLRDKVLEISRAIQQGWSWARIELEMAKCEVVCRNCHARRTHQRRLEQAQVR